MSNQTKKNREINEITKHTLFVCDEISFVIICLARVTISEERTSNN
jgi:hypothetical protein